MEVTTARILDRRSMRKKDKTYRLAIRVTYNRKPIQFPTDLRLTEEDYQKLDSPNIGARLKEIRDKFKKDEERAKKIIENLGTFTFFAFREEFYKGDCKRNNKKQSTGNDRDSATIGAPGPTVMPTPAEGRNKKYGKRKYDRIRSNVDYEKLGPLAVAYGEYIKLLEIQERIGTSECYFSSLMSLLRFRQQLRFEDITVKFLYEFERWMVAKNNSLTTVGIHLRSLRAIINLRGNKKLFTEESYPFGRGKYIIPKGTNIKKALSLAEIKLIYDYSVDEKVRPEDKRNLLFAKAMWFFGFFANGINPKDIVHLKYKNIDEDGFIILLREKTKFTTRENPKPLIIPINEDMKEIMQTWGNYDKSPDNYIFPVLTQGLSAHRQRELVQGFTALINDWMKYICTKVGITKKVRTMEYRHSMATILKRAGVNTSYIQEVLGHQIVTTTENYLDSFELDVKKQYSELLQSFKNIKASPCPKAEKFN